MKRILITLFIIASFLTLGCQKLKLGNDFISKAPGVDVTKDTIFSNLESATRFLTSCYYWLPFGLSDWSPSGAARTKNSHVGFDMIESCSDLAQNYLAWAGIGTYVYPGQVDPILANYQNEYSGTLYGFTDEGTWKGIRNSFIFIENIDRVPNVDPAYVKRMKAEARCIIAILNYDMFRHYGGLPWIDHAANLTDDMSKYPRLTAQAYCDSIVALIDKYSGDLPWALAPSDVEQMDGRLTQAGLLAIKARLLLFNASPLFNDVAPYLDGEAAQKKMVWHGGYDKNLWKRAADAAHDLITKVESTGDYKLYHKAGNTFRQDFREGYITRGSSEILIETRTENYTVSNTDFNYYRMVNVYASVLPTDDYVRMFQTTDGKSITDPTSIYDPTKPYLNRDPRLYETVLVNGDTYQGRTAELYIGGRERTTVTNDMAHTGYLLRKFNYDGMTLSLGQIWNYPLIRLEEVYLTYAEADNEFNGGPSAEGYRCVNIVRNRVGMPNLPAGMTQIQFREAILNERAVEFMMEEVRWNDMTRWKRASDFTKPLHEMNITKTGATFTYSTSLCPARYWQANWSPKWYMSFFPQNEMNKEYGLVQNPGW